MVMTGIQGVHGFGGGGGGESPKPTLEPRALCELFFANLAYLPRYEAGLMLLLLVSVYKVPFSILVSEYMGCPFGGVQEIYTLLHIILPETTPKLLYPFEFSRPLSCVGLARFSRKPTKEMSVSLV